MVRHDCGTGIRPEYAETRIVFTERSSRQHNASHSRLFKDSGCGARVRLQFLLLCGALVGIGLFWRLVPLGLPAFPLKYGGSVLWGALVYFLVRTVMPYSSPKTAAFVASFVALVVECSRLFHEPWLDAFRLTLPGALLLGRIFSLWNLLAYGVGIGCAATGDLIILYRFR
jgi:Protein of unknown function (DUF2809)